MVEMISVAIYLPASVCSPQYYVEADTVECNEDGLVEAFTLNGVTYRGGLGYALATAMSCPYSSIIVVRDGVLVVPPCSLMMMLDVDVSVNDAVAAYSLFMEGRHFPQRVLTLRSQRLPTEAAVLLCQLCDLHTGEEIKTIAHALLNLPVNPCMIRITLDEWVTLFYEDELLNDELDEFVTMNRASVRILRPYMAALAGSECVSPLSDLSEIATALNPLASE